MADKKTVALSVAGILASLVLAYLLWRVQQRDSVAASANDQANQAAADAAAQAQADNESNFLASFQSQASSGGGGGGSFVSGSTGESDIEPTDDSALISSIISGYSAAASNTGVPATTSQYLNQGLSQDMSDSTAVNNIPTSLSQIIAPTSTSSINNTGTATETQGGASGSSSTPVATPILTANPAPVQGGNTMVPVTGTPAPVTAPVTQQPTPPITIRGGPILSPFAGE